MLPVRAPFLFQTVAGEAQADTYLGTPVRVCDLQGGLQVPGCSERAQEHPHGKWGVPVFRVWARVHLEVSTGEAPKDPQRGC